MPDFRAWNVAFRLLSNSLPERLALLGAGAFERKWQYTCVWIPSPAGEPLCGPASRKGLETWQFVWYSPAMLFAREGLHYESG